jgi:hypothetical protein
VLELPPDVLEFLVGAHLFRELSFPLSVIEGENGHGNASQSGARQRFFAPGARTHVMSPSFSSTGIKGHIARQRGRDKEAEPHSRPLGQLSLTNPLNNLAKKVEPKNENKFNNNNEYSKVATGCDYAW